jgi:hypothetical protein
MGLTELVINGQVYAERKGMMEPTSGYTLKVNVNGVNVCGELTAAAAIIYANEQQIARKIRLV